MPMLKCVLKKVIFSKSTFSIVMSSKPQSNAVMSMSSYFYVNFK